jgi:hypothetical protein
MKLHGGSSLLCGSGAAEYGYQGKDIGNHPRRQHFQIKKPPFTPE